MNTVPITAIVTAYKRVDATLVTLGNLSKCDPCPAEILVHVDGNELDCAMVIRRDFPGVRVIVSESNVGPGGARNKLLTAASYEIVASFDDDSFPLDDDYFARIQSLTGAFPEAAVISAAVYHRHERILPDACEARWVADFCGGACAYRRSVFLTTGGYVPMPLAYGMEEVDLAIRLHALGASVLGTRWLRVFHDTDFKRQNGASVTAASVANAALFAYLRYPPALWPVGAVQLLNLVVFLLRRRQYDGILRGLIAVPRTIVLHKSFRDRVGYSVVLSYLRRRRRPLAVEWSGGTQRSNAF